MDESALQRLGLTAGEIRVYLALNKLQQTTVGPIGKESGVSKSKIYDILDKLIAKGLVGRISKNDVQHFTANDPHMLLDYVETKESALQETKSAVEKLIPQLLLERSMQPEKNVAEIYEGFHGVRALREQLLGELPKGDVLRVLGAPKVANEKWEGWFLDFHRHRIKNKVSLHIIYESDAKQFAAVRKKMKYTKVKYYPTNAVSPNWIDIFPDTVLFILVMTHPIAFVVRDKTIAASFKSYFELLWEQSIDA